VERAGVDAAALGIELEQITDPALRRAFQVLLALVQTQAEENRVLREENRVLREENRVLREEIARLKKLPPRPPAPPPLPRSSEKARAEPTTPKAPKPPFVPDTTRRCVCDRTRLPADVVAHGAETFDVQELLVQRANIRFERERLYSPSLRKTYLAPLPAGFDTGHLGPGLRAFVLTLHAAANVTQPKLQELLASLGLHVSDGELHHLLVEAIEPLHAERADILKAGLASGPWQQIDDTGTSVAGHQEHCFALGNPLFTVFDTRPSKDRLTVLSVLQGQPELAFRVDARAVGLVEAFGASEAAVHVVRTLMAPTRFPAAAFEQALAPHRADLGALAYRQVREACALAEYEVQTAVPVVQALLADEARNFDRLTDERGLCWIHEGRHYTKLVPGDDAAAAKELDAFQDTFWGYYRELRAYRAAPTVARAAALSARFDVVFGVTATWAPLAARIAKTRANKEDLLLVLTHPELPLHNNDMELAARQRVRKRDASLAAQSRAGVRAWDTLQTLVATAKKLGVSVYAFFADRVRGQGKIPNLATTIRERTPAAALGGSWMQAVPSG
jgi:hypothetical protein